MSINNATIEGARDGDPPITTSFRVPDRSIRLPFPTAWLAVSAFQGRLFAVGGFSGSFVNTVFAYDPLTNTWTTKSSMPTAREQLAVGVIGTSLYAVGGQGVGALN